ncbi:hypothetical protein [Nocardia cyriacigeorgica]|jgi:hypothetical protein|uniref:hypothetical protein n=1 Tax=Nocardia cyriacigeorgica TaxID=135487 RepID=UPI0005650773|nr:hypothetical protein [Nocardia cyriacigeorgica]AVH20629.1 hypothetical protein C5B73_03210 [Nocardia cyriacigeorgica]PPJ02799.1 hypothetical protein C5E43_25955 [Nocardia cyriacigeorgica]TLF55382.1 hypothetical protein FEK31_20305 [Nocardia cyriacigeorgica]
MTTDSGSTVGVKTGELGKLGNDLRSSAAVIKDQVKKVADNLVGPSVVGRHYSTEGRDIQTGLEAVKKWLEDWAEAGSISGDTIGANIVSISNVDEQNATDTTKAGS